MRFCSVKKRSQDRRKKINLFCSLPFFVSIGGGVYYVLICLCVVHCLHDNDILRVLLD